MPGFRHFRPEPDPRTTNAVEPVRRAAGEVLNVRYRAGIVGERSRVVHAATWTQRGVLITLCGMPLDPTLVEESSGMPCMRCVRIAAQRSNEDG